MATPDEAVEAQEPKYERFLARYPSGVCLPCHYPGGCTLQEAKVLHLYAVVEADEDSRVHVEAGL